MTEQKVQTFGERLARIWEPSQVSMSDEHQKVQWHQNKGILHFISSFTACVHLLPCFVLDTYIFVLRRQVDQTITGNLSCVLSTGRLRNDASKAQDQDQEAQLLQFDKEWMPYFRRSCWLSGCPIDASAHEKAEWIQGFSREVVEAWNLKM